MVLFWKAPAVFNQWTPSPFTVDGIRYTCAEQFMMASKARLFGDAQVEQKILKSNSPRTHKMLGRQVANFDAKIWNEASMEVVVTGNMHKFSQNEAMKRELLATGEKMLVEASPLDAIWGIGLAASDPRSRKKSTWRGTNKLGLALEEGFRRISECIRLKLSVSTQFLVLPNTLIVAGVLTNQCIESVVHEAADRGYKVVVVEDACAGTTAQDHQESLKNLAGYARVLSDEETVKELYSLPSQ